MNKTARRTLTALAVAGAAALGSLLPAELPWMPPMTTTLTAEAAAKPVKFTKTKTGACLEKAVTSKAAEKKAWRAFEKAYGDYDSSWEVRIEFAGRTKASCVHGAGFLMAEKSGGYFYNFTIVDADGWRAYDGPLYTDGCAADFYSIYKGHKLTSKVTKADRKKYLVMPEPGKKKVSHLFFDVPQTVICDGKWV